MSVQSYEPPIVTQEIADGPNHSYNTGVMPRFVAEWFGLDGNPSLPDPSTPHYVAATNLNDQLLRSFSQIGDAFELKYLDGEKAEAIVARGESA